MQLLLQANFKQKKSVTVLMNRDISRTLELSIISQMSTVEWQLLSRVLLYTTYYSKYMYICYYQGYCTYNVMQYSRSNSSINTVLKQTGADPGGEKMLCFSACMYVCILLWEMVHMDINASQPLRLCTYITSNFSHGTLKTWKGLSTRVLATSYMHQHGLVLTIMASPPAPHKD